MNAGCYYYVFALVEKSFRQIFNLAAAGIFI